MVMEFMSGGELFDRIKAKRSFTELEASDVMKQVSLAMPAIARVLSKPSFLR